ncbi:MAG: helix-turn-helix domain-containing protein, partial [Rubrivivax sp.]|nr:helix-turn-helix domain-containing protein [Rubrivivax sp.]
MRCKKPIDARSYSHEALEQLRRGAVKRVEGGASPEAVAVGLGINRRTMYRWLEAYHYGGESALAAKPIPGAPPKLDAKCMARLARMIREKTPLQYKFEFAL